MIILVDYKAHVESPSSSKDCAIHLLGNSRAFTAKSGFENTDLSSNYECLRCEVNLSIWPFYLNSHRGQIRKLSKDETRQPE